MEHFSGPGGGQRRTALRLVDPEAGPVWEPDPADDADDLDALTELFIGEDEPGTADVGAIGAGVGNGVIGSTRSVREPLRESREEASLEAIITGHLPVRGTVWVRAYAARVAGASGAPVALVRVCPDRTAVELIGSSAETDPVADIRAAIETAHCATDRWLLHFDELDQAGLLRSGMIDRVTVLSGADEPAIVSAYRLFKSVAESRDEPAAAGISIVGSGPADTERATARLVTAARQFLGIDLETRPSVPRVGAASGTLLGDCDERLDPADVIAMIVEAGSAAGRQTPGHVRGAGSAAGVGNVVEPKPVAEPVAAASVRREADGVDGRPDPASLIAGLVPLDLPCPVSPGVSMAADRAGVLHLVSWWRPGAASELLRAAAWARVNMPLLARVAPGLSATAGEPGLHAVCSDLAAAADLRGSGVRVHLASPVPPRAEHGWMVVGEGDGLGLGEGTRH